MECHFSAALDSMALVLLRGGGGIAGHIERKEVQGLEGVDKSNIIVDGGQDAYLKNGATICKG